MKRARTRLLFLVAMVSFPATAWAGGITVARFGGEHGLPMSENLTSMYYNPAGLAFGSGTRMYIDGQFILRFLSYDRPTDAIDHPNQPPGGAGTPTEALSANSGKASLANFIYLPFVAVGSDLGVKNLGVALGLYVPFGGQAQWSQNSAYKGTALGAKYPGAVDGVERWSTISGTISSIYITGAGAYRILDNLSLGVGVNLVSNKVQTIRARNGDGTDDLVTADGALKEGRAFLDTTSTTVSLGGGILWQPSNEFRVGLSYQSQPGFGELTYKGTLSLITSTQAAPTVSNVKFTQSLPDIFRLGAAWRPTRKLELKLSGSLERWSVMTHQCIFLDEAGTNCKVLSNGQAVDTGSGIILNIPRNWTNGWNVRGGVNYWLSEPVVLSVGLEYDKNVVPDATIDASLIDMDKLVPAAELVWDNGTWTVSGTFTQVIYFSRTAAVSAVTAFEQPSKSPSGAGSYSQAVSLLILGLGYHL